MAQIYKVIQPLELSGKTYRLGEEVALSAREAEDLMNKGFLANTRNGFPNSAAADAKNQEQSREANMDDKNDAALVADAQARKDAKHSELQTAEAEREEAKNEREAEKDAARQVKVGEAKELAVKLGREDLAAIEAMPEEQLDKEISEMKGAEAADVKEEKVKAESKPKAKTK